MDRHAFDRTYFGSLTAAFKDSDAVLLSRYTKAIARSHVLKMVLELPRSSESTGPTIYCSSPALTAYTSSPGAADALTRVCPELRETASGF